MHMNPDKFGYYQYNGQKTFSKLEALEWSKGDQIHWNFNDDVFSKVNWKVEPQEDLWELYKARARQIREEYDYVVLWYSGGMDSDNMIRAWIDSGAKIDEIATWWNYDTTGDLYNAQNIEISQVVLPNIKKFKEQTEFKFRLFDNSKFMVSSFDVISDGLEYCMNYTGNLMGISKNTLRDHIKDYKDMIASGKKLCFVWGLDKPLVNKIKNEYFFHFTDLIDGGVGPYVQNRFNDGWYDELFYWTPDLPEIMVKQAHIIMRYRKLVEKGIHPLSKDVETLLIYPHWNLNNVSIGKSPSIIYSQRDSWFLTSSNGKKFIDIVESFFRRSNNYISMKDRKSILPNYSKRYWLE